MLGYIAAQTERLHAVDGDDADHHQRPGEDRRGLRDAPAPGRRPGRPDDGPRQHRPGLPVVRPGHPQRHPARRRELRAAAPAVARGRRRLGGQVPHAAAGLHLDARARSTASRRSSGTARSAARRSPSRPPTTATASSTTTSSGRPSTPSGWSSSTAGASSTTATAPPTRPSSASAARSSCGRTARTRSREFRPYFDNAPVYGHGPSLEDFTAQTPLTVGSPQQVIERTLGFRDYVGDYQRQLFLVDHAGPAAEDGPRAARPPRRGGRAGAAQGVRRAQAGARAGRADPRVAGRRGGRRAPAAARRRRPEVATEVAAR